MAALLVCCFSLVIHTLVKGDWDAVISGVIKGGWGWGCLWNGRNGQDSTMAFRTYLKIDSQSPEWDLGAFGVLSLFQRIKFHKVPKRSLHSH